MTTNRIIHHEGREYDLTELETPFGLLPEPVREALRAWPHGLERFAGGVWQEAVAGAFVLSYAFRAKPAPKITDHVLWWGPGCDAASDGWQGKEHTHKITVRYPGEALPFGTYTGPDGAEFVVEDATGGTNDE